MSKGLIKALLPVNCAYNYRAECRDSTTIMSKCYSTTCMLNQDASVASDIQKKGCEIYKKDFVQSIINKQSKL